MYSNVSTFGEFFDGIQILSKYVTDRDLVNSPWGAMDTVHVYVDMRVINADRDRLTELGWVCDDSEEHDPQEDGYREVWLA